MGRRPIKKSEGEATASPDLNEHVSSEAHGDARAEENEPETAEKEYPAAIRLTHPYSFIEEVHNKGVFSWLAGEVVTNPETVKMLIKRTPLWEAIECQEASARQR